MLTPFDFVVAMVEADRSPGFTPVESAAADCFTTDTGMMNSE